MFRSITITLVFVLLLSANALAGFGSYSSPYNSDSIIAPIQIKDKGIYNLVVSIQFLNEPYDRKPYNSDEYEKFIRRLSVEWSGVALLQILKSTEQNINDLAGLKQRIEGEILKLADGLKRKYKFDNNVEVIFSISNFFLLEPRNK